MKTFCGMDCCSGCPREEDCGGCDKTKGHPFGGTCIAADIITHKGHDAYVQLKTALIAEFNALNIKDLHIDELHLLNGFFVNLKYPLANGQSVRLLEDSRVYFGNQIEIPGQDRCYGIIADTQFLLVCEYGCNGSNPEIILFKKR